LSPKCPERGFSKLRQPIGAPDSLTYVGHGTVLIEVDGTRLLTDPILRNRVGPLVRHGAAPAPATTAGLDAVLISHLHRDHADLASLRRLGRGLPLLVPPGSRELFERLGFGSVTELAPGESSRVGELAVTAVEARHEAGRRRFARQSQAIGFLVRGRRSVYFAGDTDFFDGMRELGPGLDLALLPVWGWGPNLGPGHLDPAAAARAAAAISPRLAVPIHWGTLYPFGLGRVKGEPLRRPGREFADRLHELAPQVETRVLSPGESTSLA
jgi:L-ascorbate metabolism protein UlaG (beta-lactamase superfamily)